MADGIDFDDAEYTLPPGELPPQTGPQIVGMRLDSIEGRLGRLERGRGEISRQLTDIQEAARIAVDALTYLSGTVERVKVLISENGTTDTR